MNEPVIQSKKIRKKFDKVFKQHAVELWLNSGRPATEVATELGFHLNFQLIAGAKSSSQLDLTGGSFTSGFVLNVGMLYVV